MGDLYLEAYHVEEDILEASIETVICLTTLHYLGNPTSARIHFILKEKLDLSSVELRLDGIVYDLANHIAPPTSFCALPVFHCDDNISCVAGFCAVLRKLVKCCDTKWYNLLGFREACLIACAEVSIWTKFCEVDLIAAAKSMLEISPGQDIPIELARLEQHLDQPIRVHNIDKLKNREHKYVEGPHFLLTDLLLSVPIYIILEKLQCWDETILPLTIKWIKTVIDQHDFKKELDLLVFDRGTTGDMAWNLPTVPKESLYKRDPRRYKPSSKIFTQQPDIDYSMEVISSINMMVYKEPLGHQNSIDENIPKPDVPQGRLKRKMEQLFNLVKSTLLISKNGDIIVDFCSGSGHLGLILAHCLPKATIILLDNKENSLNRARQRLKQLEISNVFIIQANLDYFIGNFQVGVSLHACGVASDLVIQKCLQHKANIVLCPCCYGGIQKNHMIKYPQSEEFRSVGLDERSYIVLGHCADQAGTEQGEQAMVAVDSDRCLLAMNQGYNVTLSKLIPASCTTRNNLIVATISCPNLSSTPSLQKKRL